MKAKLTYFVAIVLLLPLGTAANSFEIETIRVDAAGFGNYDDYSIITIQGVASSTFIENIQNVSIVNVQTTFLTNVSTTQLIEGDSIFRWWMIGPVMEEGNYTAVVNYGGPCGTYKTISIDIQLTWGFVSLPEDEFIPTDVTISCPPEDSSSASQTSSTSTTPSESTSSVSLPYYVIQPIIGLVLIPLLLKKRKNHKI